MKKSCKDGSLSGKIYLYFCIKCFRAPGEEKRPPCASLHRAAFLKKWDQKSALRAVRGKGSTSRMFCMPVRYITSRSKPRPKPACGVVP